MNTTNEEFSEDERDTIRKLREAYVQDERLPEEIAEARAFADVRHLAGRGDGSFDASSEVQDKKGGFENDGNKPAL